MVNFAIYKSLLGFIYIEYAADFITKVRVLASEPENFGIKSSLTNEVFFQLNDYFVGRRRYFNFPYTLKGSEFQKKVWAEICHIPYGETRSYKEIALLTGNGKASRAVGMASNKNPILFVVPCHRVVGSNGKVTGFASPIWIKEFLLKLERKNG